MRLRFASYNVHSWIGRDGRCDPARTVCVLRELDAEVVALQEARRLDGERLTAPLAELCDEGGYELVQGPTIVRGEASYGNAVLSRLPVREVVRTDLSVARREARGALSVCVEAGGWQCRVVATHLGLRGRERRAQVDRLLDWIGAQMTRSAPDALALAGDFNEWWPGATVLRRLDAAFGRAISEPTFPAWRPWLRLDRIWVQPPSLLRRRLGAHRSPLAQIASDHLPILVELELPPRGADRAGRSRGRLRPRAESSTRRGGSPPPPAP